MNLVQRYMFRQLLGPFITASAAFAGLAVLTQSLSRIDLISQHRDATLAFLEATFLAIPQVLAVLSPFALFIAVLVGLSRLYSDSEATVASAAGLSRWGILSPIMRLAVFAALLNFGINLFVQPLAYQRLRETIHELRTDVAASLVRPGEFSSLGSGVTLYAREADGAGRMREIFIHDARNENEISSYAAREGVIVRGETQPSMVLIDGNVQQLDQNGELSFLTFERYEFDMGEFVESTSSLFLKESDRFLPDLFFPDAAAIARADGAERLYAEAHYRISSPLYNIALALIAAAAFMVGPHSRLGNSKKVMLAVAIALSLRLIGFGAQSAANDSNMLNLLQYALPILGSAGALLLIFNRRRVLTFAKPRRSQEVPA